MKRTTLGLIAILGLTAISGATTYYADPNSGADTNPGSLSQPFKTFDKCVTSLKAAGDVCDLRAGTYYTGSPVVTASGTQASPIEVRGHAGEKVVIRQGSPVTWSPSFTDHSDYQVYTATFDYNAVIAKQRSYSNFFERGVQIWNDDKWLAAASIGMSPGAYTYWPIPGILVGDNTTTTSTQNKVPLMSYIYGEPPTNEFVGTDMWINGDNHVTWHSQKIVASSRYSPDRNYFSVSVTPEATEPMDANSYFYLIGNRYLMRAKWDWAWDGNQKKLFILMPYGSNPNDYPIRVQTTSVALTLRNVSNWTIHDIQFEGVVPTIDGNTSRLEYHHLNVTQAGLLNFDEAIWDYQQHAGIVLGDDSHLHHSVINNCWGRCVDVNGARDTVENNVISNGTLRGQYEGTITVQKSNALIQRNTLILGSHHGILVMGGGANSIVRRNWVDQASQNVWNGSGIAVGAHDGIVTIDSNLVTNPGNIGANILLDQASHNNEVFNNVLTGTGAAFKLKQNPFNGDRSSRSNHIGNNSATTTWFVEVGDLTDMTGSYFRDNIMHREAMVVGPYEYYPTLPGPANVSDYQARGLGWQGNLPVNVDPRFKDPDNKDFSLLAGSPAIDYGMVYRPAPFNGTSPDAGAVEAGSKPWVFGAYDPQPTQNTVLGFEDPALWTVSWNGTAQTSRSAEAVEGSYSLRLVPNGYVPFESPPLDQSQVAALGKIQLSIKLSTLATIFWAGDIQFYFDCPSLGLWNQYVGAIILTGLPLNQWNDVGVAIPTYLANQLAGKTYSDFKIRMAVNVQGGSGPVLLDNMRFTP